MEVKYLSSSDVHMSQTTLVNIYISINTKK